MIQFTASIHRIAIDHEGETTLTLKLPLTDLPKATQLPAMKQRVLKVTVEAEEAP